MSDKPTQKGIQKVLIDQVGAVQAIPLAEDDGSGILYAEGKIGHCGVATANGRVYPRKVMESQLKKMQIRVENNSAIGAVDHPGDGKSRIVGQAGTILRKIWMNEGGEVFGKFEIVEESSAGKDLAAFLRRGAQIGVSSRGMGSTRPGPDGQYIVGEDYRLTAYDFVADPAVSDAYPKVFTEDEDANVTVEQLKAHYPHIIAQIEEAACMKAQLTCEAVFAEESVVQESSAVVKAKEELRGDLSETIRAEQYVQARADLNNEFAARLVEAVEQLRPQIVESVKAEMASNPEEMTARQRLEHVASFLTPFAPSQDAKQVIFEKDAVISELKTALAGHTEVDQRIVERCEKAEGYARMLAFRLHVEERVGGRPDADELKTRIGDVTTYKSSDALKEAVLEVVHEADLEIERRAAYLREAQAKANARISRMEEEKRSLVSKVDSDRAQTRQGINSLVESMNARMAAVENQLGEKDQQLAEAQMRQQELEEKLSRENMSAKRSRAIEYAGRRTQGHPSRGAIMEEVQHASHIMSAEEINDLAESMTPRAQAPGGPAERVRAAMSQGRDHGGGFLGEDVASASFESIPDLAKLGINPQDVRAYGGVRRR